MLSVRDRFRRSTRSHVPAGTLLQADADTDRDRAATQLRSRVHHTRCRRCLHPPGGHVRRSLCIAQHRLRRARSPGRNGAQLGTVACRNLRTGRPLRCSHVNGTALAATGEDRNARREPGDARSPTPPSSIPSAAGATGARVVGPRAPGPPLRRADRGQPRSANASIARSNATRASASAMRIDQSSSSSVAATAHVAGRRRSSHRAASSLRTHRSACVANSVAGVTASGDRSDTCSARCIAISFGPCA